MNKFFLPVEFGVVWPVVFVLRVYNCNVQISKKAWVMFFVCYGNFPSYCYRALLVITWCYGARLYANQYMKITILNRTALFTAFLSPCEVFVRRAILHRITKWPWKINRFHIIRLFLFLSKSWWSGNLSHAIKSKPIGGFHAISADTNNTEWWNEQMLVDKESELMSDLLYTVHQHRGDNVTWKPPIWQNNLIALF